MMLKDTHDRPLLNLRVSITQRCNLRCLYCHQEGEQDPLRNIAEEMSLEEILRIVGVGAKLGLSKVKITGGEPLIRQDILEIVEGIAKNQRIKDLSMTTNGSLLAPLARELAENGLIRVNINIPTLTPKTYRRLTGGELQDVIAGVKAAVDAKLYPVKLNMLVLRGENEDDIPEMMRFAEKTGVVLQLIELEPINVSEVFYFKNHVKLSGWEDSLKQEALTIETRQKMQNRQIYHLPNLNVEVIRPIENPLFCSGCTRLRVTSSGKLKPCLMKNNNLVDVLTPIRNGASDAEVERLFKNANFKRHPYCEAQKTSEIHA